jgi:hypothetical protein
MEGFGAFLYPDTPALMPDRAVKSGIKPAIAYLYYIMLASHCFLFISLIITEP